MNLYLSYWQHRQCVFSHLHQRLLTFCHTRVLAIYNREFFIHFSLFFHVADVFSHLYQRFWPSIPPAQRGRESTGPELQNKMDISDTAVNLFCQKRTKLSMGDKSSFHCFLCVNDLTYSNLHRFNSMFFRRSSIFDIRAGKDVKKGTDPINVSPLWKTS